MQFAQSHRPGAVPVTGPSTVLGLGCIARQDIDAPGVWELASRPWALLASPQGRGPFRNRKQILVTPHCLLCRECFLGALRVQGMTPAGTLARLRLFALEFRQFRATLAPTGMASD